MPAAIHHEIDGKQTVRLRFIRFARPTVISIRISKFIKVTRIRALTEFVGERQLRGQHSGINRRALQCAGIAQNIGQQSENREEANEENSRSNHHFEQSESRGTKRTVRSASQFRISRITRRRIVFRN